MAMHDEGKAKNEGKLKDMEKVGRPMVDTVNQMLGEGGETGGGDAGEAQPLVAALDVTPEHAKHLLDAARAPDSPYKDMSPQDLADKLASDAEARADLERRVESARGAPKPEMTKPGGVSESGVAAWPGSPAVGQPAMPAGGGAEGAAKWPGM